MLVGWLLTAPGLWRWAVLQLAEARIRTRDDCLVTVMTTTWPHSRKVKVMVSINVVYDRQGGHLRYANNNQGS